MSLSKDLEKKFPEVTVSVVPLSESQVSLSSVESGVPASEKPEDEAPDGGWVAWRQVIAGHFINAISCGYSATFGIYQLYYTEALNLPAAQIAWIGSFQIFLNSLVCLIGGSLCDAGYARHCVWAGALCVLIGTFMTSIATEYYQIFLAQGVLQGFGLGLMYMPSTAVVSSYFNRKRSLALTIASAGTGTGSIVFPATVQFLIPKIGFAWAVRCSGFVAVVICVIGCLLLKPRLAPRKGAAAAIIDVSAFKEIPYVLFAVGTWFFYWALYFGFFYVSLLSALASASHWTSAYPYQTDQQFRTDTAWRGFHPYDHGESAAGDQRRVHAGQSVHWLDRRQPSRPPQHLYPLRRITGGHAVHLDRCDDRPWHVHLGRGVRHHQRCGPGGLCRGHRRAHQGPEEDRHPHWNDLRYHLVRGVGGTSHGRLHHRCYRWHLSLGPGLGR